MKLILILTALFFSLDLDAQFCYNYKSLGKEYSIGTLKDINKNEITVIDAVTSDTSISSVGFAFDKFELISFKSNIMAARKSYFDNSVYYQGSNENVNIKLVQRSYCSGFIEKNEEVYTSDFCEINFYYFKDANTGVEAFVIKIEKIIPKDAPYMYCENAYIAFDTNADFIDFVEKLDHNKIRKCSHR